MGEERFVKRSQIRNLVNEPIKGVGGRRKEDRGDAANCFRR